jgi:hypothetical protein
LERRPRIRCRKLKHRSEEEKKKKKKKKLVTLFLR